MSSCAICCEKYTKSARKPIKCPSCDFEACKQCVRHFLTTQNTKHCMNSDCNVKWTQTFMTINLNKSFMNNEYKEYLKHQLTNEEMSKLSDTQPAVDRELRIMRLQNIMSENTTKIIEFQKQIENIEKIQDQLSDEINQLYKRLPISKKNNNIKCQANDCRGTLNDDNLCTICGNYTCLDCMQVIGQDQDSKHECDPADIETVNMIQRETKPCPQCNTRIHKIEGCDQMWCTLCNIAFDWVSGRLISSNLHNPHFTEWLEKRMNGIKLRSPGDFVCGGLVQKQAISRTMGRTFNLIRDHLGFEYMIDNNNNIVNFINKFYTMLRTISRINNFELFNLRTSLRDYSNEDLRVNYILKRINKEEFSEELWRSHQNYNVKIEQLHILELFSTVGIETYNDMFEFWNELKPPSHKSGSHIKINSGQIDLALQYLTYCNDKLGYLHNLTEYVNKELNIISVGYNKSMLNICLTDNFYEIRNIKSAIKDIV